MSQSMVIQTQKRLLAGSRGDGATLCPMECSIAAAYMPMPGELVFWWMEHTIGLALAAVDAPDTEVLNMNAIIRHVAQGVKGNRQTAECTPDDKRELIVATMRWCLKRMGREEMLSEMYR